MSDFPGISGTIRNNRVFLLLVVTDYNPFEGRPALKAWIESVKSKTSPHYDDSHKSIYKVASRNSKAKL